MICEKHAKTSADGWWMEQITSFWLLSSKPFDFGIGKIFVHPLVLVDFEFSVTFPTNVCNDVTTERALLLSSPVVGSSQNIIEGSSNNWKEISKSRKCSLQIKLNLPLKLKTISYVRHLKDFQFSNRTMFEGQAYEECHEYIASGVQKPCNFWADKQMSYARKLSKIPMSSQIVAQNWSV